MGSDRFLGRPCASALPDVRGFGPLWMRYQTKLLVTAGLLLAMSLCCGRPCLLGCDPSHRYLTRSRIAHEELERQLQLSRHSQQLFKTWTDTLLTGISDRPLGAAYLHKVIEIRSRRRSGASPKGRDRHDPESERRRSAEVERLNAIKKEFQHASTSSRRSSSCAAADAPTTPGQPLSRSSREASTRSSTS